MASLLTDEDLEAAVRAGVVTPQLAADLRAFVESRRTAPRADDEQFRLLTGFNDIFVAMAILMVLIALGWLASRQALGLGFGLVALVSWALAEFFTARRRMALPSILLLLSWVGCVFGAAAALTASRATGAGGPWILGLVALLAGAAAYAHWLRFKVPITVAAGTCAAFAALIAFLSGALPGGDRLVLPLTFLSGLGVFGLALWWDASDPLRRTRRADVAFWLHLAAAPLIVHPAFSLLGLNAAPGLSESASGALGPMALTRPAAAVAVYLILALVALVIDRRALMVSALAYLLYAMNAFFQATGALSVSFALSALLAGAGLLLLSAYWRTARQRALGLAPASLKARLPAA
ncbi:MAG: hypothetical protein ACLPSW_00720 [Roseiarcus sp.]